MTKKGLGSNLTLTGFNFLKESYVNQFLTKMAKFRIDTYSTGQIGLHKPLFYGVKLP